MDQNILLAVLLLAVGFMLTIKGGDWFVDAAIWVAEVTNIPKILIGATIVAIPELGLPPIVHIILCFVVGMLFAGLWGAIPGYLRAYKGVNEVTATIMLSYVAIYLTNWVVSGSPLAQEGAYFPMSLPFLPSPRYPFSSFRDPCIRRRNALSL